MNKSVLGFLFGIAIVIAGGVGYFLSANPRPAEAPAAPREAAAKPDGDNALGAALAAAAAKKKEEGTKTTPVATPENKPEEKKAEAPAKPAMSKAVAADGMSVNMARTLSSPTYTPGGTVDVAISIEVQGSDPVRALGIQEVIPDGFSFDAFIGGAKPDIAPEPGRTGSVDFAWIQVPSAPINLTYRVKAADGATGTKTFSGQTLMRAAGPELRSDTIVNTIDSSVPGSAPTPAPAADAAAEAPAAATPMPAPEDPAKALEANKVKLEEAAARMRAAEAKKAEDQKFAVEVAHAVPAGGYTAGETLEISATLTYSGTTPVSALAFVETLPVGWTFDKVTGGSAPAVAPPAGKAGNATFIWIDVPSFPATVTYTVNVPAGEAGARTLAGKAAYRTDSGQIEGPPSATEINNK